MRSPVPSETRASGKRWSGATMLLIAGMILCLLAPLLGLALGRGPDGLPRFPGSDTPVAFATSFVAAALCMLRFGADRHGARGLSFALGLLALWAVLLVGFDVSAFLGAGPSTPRSHVLLGLLPGLSIPLLALAAAVVHKSGDWIDQLVLAIVSVIFCLSTAACIVSFTALRDTPGAMLFGASVPLALAMALIAGGILDERRRRLPLSMLAGDMPSWRTMRIMVPLSIIVPIDRFALSANRLRIDPVLYGQLDMGVAIFNLMIVALLFNYAVWKMAREYQKVRRNEARLALAIEAPGAGVFDWNVVTGDLMWTPEAERRIGMPVGTMNRIEIWQSRVFAEDFAKIMATQAEVEKRRGDHYPFRYRMRAMSGAVRIFEGAGRCFYDDDGHIVRFVGLNLDVTEREERDYALEENEAQLRSILENVPDAMAVMDEDGSIRSFSHAAERMFGYPESDVLGEGVGILIPRESEFHGRYLDQPDDGAARELVGRTVTLQARRASGEIFPAELTLGEAHTRKGLLYIAFIRDVTERMEAERRLDDLRNEFAHSARLNAMGELAAGLAHELNQPLAAGANYLGSAEMAVEDAAPHPEIAGLIGSARGQLLRAGEIIRRLRDFLAKGTAEMRVESVGQTLRDAVELGLIGKQRELVHVRCHVARGAEQMFADRVQVQQVLVNLLRNSVQAMQTLPPEQRRLSVEAEPVDAEMLRIAVTDHGPGFSDEMLRELFTPFLSSKGQKGLGIGLSICRRIVEAHGGEMTARNLAGGGASIAFTIPRPLELAGIAGG
ncbi:MAG: PAS domain S-box protein [Novosphingobium sp.]|nr:PAS domain S-box protein [Novosphingobium sp.]